MLNLAIDIHVIETVESVVANLLYINAFKTPKFIWAQCVIVRFVRHLSVLCYDHYGFSEK